MRIATLCLDELGLLMFIKEIDLQKKSIEYSSNKKGFLISELKEEESFYVIVERGIPILALPKEILNKLYQQIYE